MTEEQKMTEKQNMKFGAKILKCSCKNNYQDKKYGSQMRVHNWGPAHKHSTPGYVCTICGSLKQ